MEKTTTASVPVANQSVAALPGKRAPAKPAPKPKEKDGAAGKLAAVAVLAAFALFFFYYFFVLPQSAFVPGGKVSPEEFKNLFSSATTVYVVMDVRGITDPVVSNNVLQCGVDFAGSSGLGGKNATFFSLSDADGCVSADGIRPLAECTSKLKGGMSIYVKGGSGGAEYFTNGMLVTVGSNYTVGTCGIKRV